METINEFVPSVKKRCDFRAQLALFEITKFNLLARLGASTASGRDKLPLVFGDWFPG